MISPPKQRNLTECISHLKISQYIYLNVMKYSDGKKEKGELFLNLDIEYKALFLFALFCMSLGIFQARLFESNRRDYRLAKQMFSWARHVTKFTDLLDRNTLNHLTVCKETRSNNLFRNKVTYKLFANKLYIYIYSKGTKYSYTYKCLIFCIFNKWIIRIINCTQMHR